MPRRPVAATRLSGRGGGQPPAPGVDRNGRGHGVIRQRALGGTASRAIDPDDGVDVIVDHDQFSARRIVGHAGDARQTEIRRGGRTDRHHRSAALSRARLTPRPGSAHHPLRRRCSAPRTRAAAAPARTRTRPLRRMGMPAPRSAGHAPPRCYVYPPTTERLVPATENKAPMEATIAVPARISSTPLPFSPPRASSPRRRPRRRARPHHVDLKYPGRDG